MNGGALTITPRFLSIQAQDFIEDLANGLIGVMVRLFLSIQAQDFIEDLCMNRSVQTPKEIPEHSSSGLH